MMMVIFDDSSNHSSNHLRVLKPFSTGPLKKSPFWTFDWVFVYLAMHEMLADLGWSSAQLRSVNHAQLYITQQRFDKGLTNIQLFRG